MSSKNKSKFLLDAYLKDNPEIFNIVLLAAFFATILYILMKCVDPAELTVVREKEFKIIRKAKKNHDRELRERSRYKKIMKKLDSAIDSQKETPFGNKNRSIITNLHNNEENLAVQVSNYMNDRGGYQFKGNPENWYVTFADQARMLYR